MLARSKTSLLFVLIALGGLLTLVSNGRITPPLTLNTFTYNTHLLPRIGERFASSRGRGAYRARTIGRRMAAYDLVGLCEVFDPQYRRALIDAARAETGGRYHVLWTNKPRGIGFANSGLLLLSRYTIEAHHAITYTEASRFSTHGFRADAFAAKGALHARLRLRDEPAIHLDCFLTHLESRSAAARAAQLRQLADFIREHAGAGRPALLMGDLNVPADNGLHIADSPYSRLVAALKRSEIEWTDAWLAAGQGAGGTSDPLSKKGGHRIDYLWVSSGAGDAPPPTVSGIEIMRFLDPGVPEGSLSDHSGIRGTVELR